MKKDTFKITTGMRELILDDGLKAQSLAVSISINNHEYHYLVSPFALLSGYFNQTTQPFTDKVVCDFYPFNCSCGEPGCAGIWNGIGIKYGRQSVEWRLSFKNGYDNFLEKEFYDFSRSSYDAEIAGLWQFIKDNEDLYDEDGDEKLSSVIAYWKKNYTHKIRYLDKLIKMNLKT